MDWFERLTGLSPDNGSGAFEMEILAAVGAICALVVFFRRRKRKSRT